MKYTITIVILLLAFAGVARDAVANGGLPEPLRSASHLANDYLSHFTPNISVRLNGDARPSSKVSDLVREGILLIRYRRKTDCHGIRLRLVLTEKGQRVAGSRGWAFNGDLLTIPLGRYAVVNKLISIRRKGGEPYSMTFQYRYEANSNARYLLSFGRASDWVMTNGRSLASKSPFQDTAYLGYSHERGWWLYVNPPRLQNSIVC